MNWGSAVHAPLNTDVLSLALENRVSSFETKFGELRSRRWELWKLILAAFLGSILTVGAGFVSRSLDRLIPRLSKPAIHARDSTDPKK